MFRPQPKTKLQIEIDRNVLALNDHLPGTEEYGTIVERLSKLHKVQHDNKREPVSPNTAMTTGANLLGILMIIQHEHIGVISSKALAFVKKV